MLASGYMRRYGPCSDEAKSEVRGPAPFLPVTPLIAAHVVAGLGAVIAGALAMLATKGGLRHRRAGIAYLVAVTILMLSGTALALEALATRRHLLILGIVTFALAMFGYAIRLRQRRRWRARHLAAMAMSYIVMLTAFYVDNGPRLPLWWRLPTWMLWILPSLVGLPLLFRAWRNEQRAAGLGRSTGSH